MSNPIKVNVIRVPGRAQAAFVNPGDTVATALEAIGESLGANDSMKFATGESVTTASEVFQGTQILISKGAKGNS